MLFSETPIVFEVEGAQCVGVLAQPLAASPSDVAVVIVVGGPQYRVGSHRQFVLLARDLAAAGISTLRFDYRGMGDSGGPWLTFEHIEADLSAAVQLVKERAGVRYVVLWGLCDGASAALMFAHKDPNVIGLVCVNPWVRSEVSLAKARLQHYYIQRLLRPDFWRKLLSGKVNVKDSIREVSNATSAAMHGPAAATRITSRETGVAFLDRMETGWTRFSGSTLFLLSERDLTAQEFRGWATSGKHRRALLNSQRTTIAVHKLSDHTFSSAEWRKWVQDATKQWIVALPAPR